MNRDDRQRAAGIGHRPPAGLGLRRLVHDRRRLISAPPAPVVGADERFRNREIEVAGNHDRDVLGAVIPLVEGPAVGVALRHGPDVGFVADGRVAVGMLAEDGFAHFLVQEPPWLAHALLVLAEDRAGFGAEVSLGVFEVLEPVRLDVDDLLEIGGVGDEVVERAIGVRRAVAKRADLRRLPVVVGILLGTAEHHVLEEMGKPGLAGFHLVAAAGANDGDVGHLARCASLDEVDPQAVLERDAVDRERKHRVRPLCARRLRQHCGSDGHGGCKLSHERRLHISSRWVSRSRPRPGSAPWSAPAEAGGRAVRVAPWQTPARRPSSRRVQAPRAA